MNQAGTGPRESIDPGTTLVDLEHLGRSRVIASCLLHGDRGVSIVDPGPSSTLPALRSGLARLGFEVVDVDSICLTHIHIDHAGATGSLVEENPGITVFVHERGAPHLVDPTRLVASTVRALGADASRVWGDFLPTPSDSLRVLKGGERFRVGGRQLEVIHTPGHASHHVSYCDETNGIAFVGDAAGVRIGNQNCILPATPPPSVNLQSMQASFEQIQARQPQRLFLTHFGWASPVQEHFLELAKRLCEWSRRVRDSLQGAQADQEQAARFARDNLAELRSVLPEEEVERYEKSAAIELCWHGLARYWRTRGSR